MFISPMATQRCTKVALAAASVLLVWNPVSAQEPLRVEVVASAPRQQEPILVRVTNLTTKKLQLVLPMYGDILASVLASDPLDVERKDGKRWIEVPVAFARPRPNGSPQIQPGETMEFKFGVFGAGEYRVRVWYVVSPPTLGPRPRPATHASVVSAPFRID
jgi:hypothetical protein